MPIIQELKERVITPVADAAQDLSLETKKVGPDQTTGKDLVCAVAFAGLSACALKASRQFSAESLNGRVAKKSLVAIGALSALTASIELVVTAGSVVDEHRSRAIQSYDS